MRNLLGLFIFVQFMALSMIAMASDRIFTPREIDDLLAMIADDDDEFHIGNYILKNKQEYMNCISNTLKIMAPKASAPVFKTLSEAASKCFEIVDRGFEIGGNKTTKDSDLYTHEFTACMKFGYSSCPDNCAEYFDIPKKYMTQQNLVFWCDCYGQSIESFAYFFKTKSPINQSNNRSVLIFLSDIDAWSQADLLKIQSAQAKCFIHSVDSLTNENNAGSEL